MLGGMLNHLAVKQVQILAALGQKLFCGIVGYPRRSLACTLLRTCFAQEFLLLATFLQASAIPATP
jgi:hypothetical protein